MMMNFPFIEQRTEFTHFIVDKFLLRRRKLRQADLGKLETRMTTLLARYNKQFSSMESIVGGVNSQKTSLKSTFDGMMASLTGKSG